MATKKSAYESPTPATDKKKALQTALSQIEKNFGKGAVMRLGDKPEMNVDAVPTGSLALDAALADIRKGKTGDFPRHLQNMHADSYTMEREQGYLYPHNFPGHWVQQQYLPDALVGTKYYEYGPNKLEQAAKQYWEAIKK